MLLQPALMLKLSLADPQTTMRDVNSIISKEGNNELPPVSPVSCSELKNSIRIWQQKNVECDSDEARAENDVNSTDSGFVRRTLSNITSPIFSYSSRADDSDRNGSETSPKIITYRKHTHERRASESYSELLDKDEWFDTKLYVKEKYRRTPYRFATMKRNVDFHQIFRSHDLTDRLLDDFACALSREILLQGRIYVTEHSVCFNSNLLGWVTSLVIPLGDVVRIEKKSTAGLFPNGISIETRTSKHNFASFLSRDATFDFIRTMWLVAVGKTLAELDAATVDNAEPKAAEDQCTSSQRHISNYIMSIDEDDQAEDHWSDASDADTSQSSDANAKAPDTAAKTDAPQTRNVPAAGETVGEAANRVTLKRLSEYRNPGPHTNPPTTIGFVPVDSEKETEVAKEVVDAPLGIVFGIMFGSANTAFHRKVLESQGATEISDYGDYRACDSKALHMERTYTYRRPLGFSIGPKSTKCCVTEVIEHMDYADHVVLLAVTATPDVPSGGSFTVRTRYYFLWAENNRTLVRIAFFIKWSGSSWIKGVVEKLTLAAQRAINADVIKMLQDEICQQTTTLVSPESAVPQQKSMRPRPPVKMREENKWAGWVAAPSTTAVVLAFLVAVLVLLIAVQWKLVAVFLQAKTLMEKQLKVTSEIIRLLLENADDRRGNKGPGSDRHEQTALLVKQALLFLDDPA
ncbi:hypothetical protein METBISCDRAFT_12620 [Metschnikowia bicuspidata]|uniref:VASt domain-containing protein n=1 Tax=Metschnikowia bicuspidata TaxID=27322 RepID=A0A4P9ZJE9_9ASCO|nr:hypothetical protein METBISCDRAFT_12620 [Metschnikowia bicuspidata]